MTKTPDVDPELVARAVAARDARLREAGRPVEVEHGVPLPGSEDLVLEAGENASPEAHAAEARYRENRPVRADDARPETRGFRDIEAREMTWAPASILPHIPDRDGWHFRWVRVSSHGDADDLNANQSFREGFVPATPNDIGNVHLSCDKSVRFPGGIEVGGLLLCKIPEETRAARERYYLQQATSQVTSVNNDMLRENDPRMPLLRPTANTRTTFGLGRGQV